MPEFPYSRFYWEKWLAEPGLKLCSWAARGLWADMLALAGVSDSYGFVMIGDKPATAADLARALGGGDESTALSLLAELEAHKVFSRDRWQRIYNRRMVKEARQREVSHENGKLGGRPDMRRGTVPKSERQRGYKKSENPEKTQRILDACARACHWCGVALTGNFHVDHLDAIRDGGGNEESNLVAACPTCNGKRALKGWELTSKCPCGKQPTDRERPVGRAVGSRSVSGRRPGLSEKESLDNPTDPNRSLVYQYTNIPKEDRIFPETTTELFPESSEVHTARRKATTRRTGTRIPDDWKPDLELVAFAKALGLDPGSVADEFVDYWRSVSGKDAIKTDWDATFRNRCRALVQYRRGSNGHARAPGESFQERQSREKRELLERMRATETATKGDTK